MSPDVVSGLRYRAEVQPEIQAEISVGAMPLTGLGRVEKARYPRASSIIKATGIAVHIDGRP
jgi:hypothetical protein